MDRVFRCVREDSSYDDIFGTKENDVNNLAEISMNIIESLIKMEVEGKLPTIAECRNLVKLGRNFVWPSKINKKEK